MKGMFLGVKVYKLKKPILLGTNIVALLAFCLVTGVILASGGIKVKKPEAAKAIAPAVETNNATNITEHTATLNGTQLTNEWGPYEGFDVRGFEYGLDTNYGHSVLDSSTAKEGYKELKAISANFKTKKQAEPFMRGLAMIIAVENSFALLNKFAGYQPSGSVNTSDINEVIKNVLTRQDKVVKDKALNIAQNVEPDIAMGLDKSALIVLLGSTIGSAIKFSNNEGTVDINVHKRINDVIITVQNNGLGIAKDKLNSLMMPFTRATDVMKYDYEGIGLGLYMDRIILEQIDGSIKLSSSPGKGTIVRMTIPNNGLAEESTNTNPATSPLSTNPTVRPT